MRISIYHCQNEDCMKYYAVIPGMILRCPYCSSKDREEVDEWSTYRINFLLNESKELQELLYKEGQFDEFAD
jgi:MoaA/NifB/PqqE/SkfB family radical SAM enzyme